VNWFKKPRVVILTIQPRDELGLQVIMGGVADTEPLWQVLLQLMEQAERECINNAQLGIKDQAVSASYLGGAEAISLLRTRLFELRDHNRITNLE
jgi:hypothetical protein